MCNRRFQPELMVAGLGRVVSTELSSMRRVGVKPSKRCEKHFRPWDQYVQRPSGRRQAAYTESEG